MEGGKGMGATFSMPPAPSPKWTKLWKIHFRNVTGPDPAVRRNLCRQWLHRHAQLMRTLHEVDFRAPSSPITSQ
jgi:hypothetical protein